MYVPHCFAEADLSKLVAVIREEPFGTLISAVDGLPLATHLPFTVTLEGTRVILTGHMARANPHWQAFGKGEALVTFLGPHGYISPAWYDHPAQNVPTWNYAAVHCYGAPRIVESPHDVRSILDTLVRDMEGAMPQPWSLDAADEAYLARLQRGIVAFEVVVTRIEGAMKFSQNHPEAECERVINILESTANPRSHRLARAMRQANNLT